MNCGFSLAGIKPAGADLHQQTKRELTNRQKSEAGSSASLDPRLERLAAAAPQLLAEKMRLSSALAGERRIVTVLFADVVGSTSLAEQMDPEDWTVIMNRAFERLVPVIYRYEGTIARLMGDALLAFFGAPVAHEDDPIRAAKAALHLIAEARAYAKEVRQMFGVDFAIRVGMNTGNVVVGEVGSNLIYEYTAMGDAVNLAARMQAAARPMTVLIAEDTYRYIQPAFEVIDQGSIAVKGKTEPVRAYEVKQVKQEHFRLRGASMGASTMVGRATEIDMLLKASSALKAELGRLVVVIGEAGMGKSRLVSEWKSIAMDQDPDSLRWVEGRCLSYGQGLPYHLCIDLLRSALGISELATEEETDRALHALLDDMFAESAGDYYPYLAHALSIKLDEPMRSRIRQLDPQAIQAQYLSSMRSLMVGMANHQPMVVVIEDLHWSDPSSVSLLMRMLPAIHELPVLFCLVSRPETDSPGWKLVQSAREEIGAGIIEIVLHPLSEIDSFQLVSNLLPFASLPESTRKLILEKSEGNPLYVEELIQMLIDQGVLQQGEDGWSVVREIEDVQIPDTLQGLILARIDRLPEDVRHVLRVAAVIGRQFPVKVLAEVLES